MIDGRGIRCEQCGKQIALRLEGELELYCPRCHHYQKIVASTCQMFLHVDGMLPGIEIREI